MQSLLADRHVALWQHSRRRRLHANPDASLPLPDESGAATDACWCHIGSFSRFVDGVWLQEQSRPPQCGGDGNWIVIDRRTFLLTSASLGAVLYSATLGPLASDALAQASGYAAEIDRLEKRAAELGLLQPRERTVVPSGSIEAFADDKERLLDLIDAGADGGPAERSLTEDAGEVLARMTAEEAQTPKGAKDTEHNSKPIHRAFKFENPAVRKEYRDLFAGCVIDETKRHLVDRDVARLLTESRKAAYKHIEAETGVPWYFVGAIHNLEASFNMTRHLHNGDSLKKRTWQVPAGRPEVWDPPNDWASSAIDALVYEKFTTDAAKKRGWTLEPLLYRLERYNGLGSRRHGIHSPYLWSYSQHYVKGKYVRDGVWDPEAISKQCGAVVLIKALIERGEVEPLKSYDATS